MYLGCLQEKGRVRLPGGRFATTMVYNMEEFLRNAVERYKKLAGPSWKIKTVATPFLEEDQTKSPQGGSPDGKVTECPWCKHTFTPTVFDNKKAYEASRAKRASAARDSPGKRKPATARGDDNGTPASSPPAEDLGRLQPIAAKVMM